MPPSDFNLALLELKNTIVSKFNAGNWQDVGLLTDSEDIINGHSRLLRSLSFGDEDYDACVTKVLLSIGKRDSDNLERISDYVEAKFGDGSEYISERPAERRITFAPSVFNVPALERRSDLVAVMMPFAGFDAVYAAIKGACADAGLECLRADDIWDESTFIQDIVNLIFQARIVVCDFSNRNPNVFYETGIAHTLGKEVVPIAQSLSDIPSDLQHHRALRYLANAEGLSTLRKELSGRLLTIKNRT